jgi:transposase-like protein
VGSSWESWLDGRRAVESLARWYVVRGRADAEPLAALSEIGTVRRLLDEAELEAVRGARRAGRSWAEIATKLGVSRQSAWERWRDLDIEAGSVDGPGTADAPGSEVPDAARALTVPAAVPAGERWVSVPDVIGMTFIDAQYRLARCGLVGIHHELAAIEVDDDDAVVTDQRPEAGPSVPRGAPVLLWIGRGGGSGVREPRRPRPTSLTGGKVVDDPWDEAVG